MSIVKSIAGNCFRSYLKAAKIQDNKILFDNFAGRGYSDNPGFIADELKKLDPSLDLVWLVNDMNIEVPEGVRKVLYGSKRSLIESATAKAWVDNIRNGHLTDKKEGQIFLQTWHGSRALKYIENEAIETLSEDYIRKAKYDGQISDGVLVDSKFQEEMFQDCFWLGEQCEILRFGLPRNDYLVNHKEDVGLRHEVRQRMGISDEEYVILYAPTFRDDGSTKGYRIDFEEVRKAFEDKMKKPCSFVIRFHPNVKNPEEIVTYNDKIRNGNIEGVQDISLISDCVISDYSSIIFDFDMLDKPVFLCALDFAEYKESRGIRPDYLELPYSLSYTNQELLASVNAFDEANYKKTVSDYNAMYPTYNKGDAGKKSAEWLLNKMRG